MLLVDTNIDWGSAHTVEDEEDVVEGDRADEVEEEPGAHVAPSYQLWVQYHLLNVVHFHNSFQSQTSNIHNRNLAPVLKLNPMSMRKMVSETQLKTTHRMERSSLKKEMATGRMIRFATSSNSMHRSQ